MEYKQEIETAERTVTISQLEKDRFFLRDKDVWVVIGENKIANMMDCMVMRDGNIFPMQKDMKVIPISKIEVKVFV